MNMRHGAGHVDTRIGLTFCQSIAHIAEDSVEEEEKEYDTFALHVVRNTGEWPLGGVGVDFEVVTCTEYTSESKVSRTIHPTHIWYDHEQIKQVSARSSCNRSVLHSVLHLQDPRHFNFDCAFVAFHEMPGI